MATRKPTKDWPEEVKSILKAELKRRNVGYRELAEKLTAMEFPRQNGTLRTRSAVADLQRRSFSNA